MKISNPRFLVALIALLPRLAYAAETPPNTLTVAERAQGWRLLWDGQTTKGWHSAKAKDFPATGWSLAKGELAVLGTKGGSIVTDEEFSAFELQLDFQVSEGGNSGVKYFVSGDGLSEPVGLEFQFLDDEKHPDAKLGVDGDRTTGSLYDLIPRDHTVPTPKAGAWHQARIVVTPTGHVEHWLDGRKVLEYERGSPDFLARVARSKFAKIPGFGLGAKGPILLQDHGDVVRFRSIKIRQL